MRTPLLLVATTTTWLGAARMPRPLAEAGFDVSVLAPRRSLYEKSRYVATIGHLDDNATPLQWVHSFAAAVQATTPRLVVPCDDSAFWLMQMLAASPPEGLSHALQLQALIRDSLGDPAWFQASVQKTLLPAAAEALGVRVPAFVVTAEAEAAREFAAVHGYPVVLKRNHSSAGEGVRICAGPTELAPAFRALQGLRVTYFARTGRELLVQEYIVGCVKSYHMAAWKGRLLTGYAAEKLERNPSPTGPSTVQRYHHDADIEEMAVKLTRGFGMTGFFSPECIVDERTGAAYLLEISRRMVPSQHRGSDIDVNHCAALYAALHGIPQTTRSGLDPGEEYIGVHFPQEWLRDPRSDWLRNYPADVPWDEPELVMALLALYDDP